MISSLLAAALLVAGAGVAHAVSGGGYAPEQQDCSKTAEAYDTADTAEPGCHTLKVNVESGDTRYGEVGLDQMRNGESTPGLLGVGSPGSDNFPHSGCAAVNANGTGGGEGTQCGTALDDGQGAGGSGAAVDGDTNSHQATPQANPGVPDVQGAATNLATNGVDVYFGADDNLDAGEHDGVDNEHKTGTYGTSNGPSDGGAIGGHVSPAEASTTPSAANPVPVAGIAFGSCADGICEEITTYRQVIYQGGDPNSSRDVANYDGKQWDPYDCSGESLEAEQACDSGQPGGPKTLNDWRDEEGTVYAEPGVQVYEDPDPQGSPIDPVAEIESGARDGGAPVPEGGPSLYPLPGTYAGTCGVILNGAPVVEQPVDPC